ncbi:MAG: hypothetical protein ABFR90_07745, partial [Planctomycetota bacterium]
SDAVDKTKKHFEGPSRMSSSNKLVIQDAITYVKGTNMLFYPPGETPENRFYSSHRFRDAEKARPYFISPQGATERPDCKLNAGYLDGSVDRFDSMDGVEVKNWGAVNYLSPRFR